MVRFDQRTDAVLDHRSWADAASLPAVWELRVSVRAGERQRLTLVAFGDHRLAGAAEFAELFGLLDECCRGWAAVGGPPADPAAPTIARPVPRPKLLPVEPAPEPGRRVA
ncbi:MAG TPA: hypothetical protein VF170_01745, partial [Planctomycetaceae bacterium]